MTEEQYILGEHARWMADRRKIHEVEMLRVVRVPEQVIRVGDVREIRQSRALEGGSGRIYLIRVVVERRGGLVTIITAYRSSKIAKYWRTT